MLIELKNFIVKLLKANIEDIKVASEDVNSLLSNVNEEPSSNVYPLIHVQLEPLSTNLSACGKELETIVLVDLTYLEGDKNTNKAMYGLIEKLMPVLAKGIVVEEVLIKPRDITSNIVEDVLHILFYLDIREDLCEENIEKFKYMNLKI